MNLSRIGVGLMRAFQRLIRQAPITIARHAGQEKIGLPVTRVLRQNAINHRAGFFAAPQAQQHARMHHITPAVAGVKLARAFHNRHRAFNVTLVNQQPHQVIQGIAILGLEFESFFKACSRARHIANRALHAPKQAPNLAIAGIKPHTFLKSLHRGSQIAARFLNIAEVLPGGGAFRVQPLSDLQHRRCLIIAPGALEHDTKQIRQREILGLARLDRRHEFRRFLMAAKSGKRNGVRRADGRHRGAECHCLGESLHCLLRAAAIGQNAGQLLPRRLVIWLARDAGAQIFLTPCHIGGAGRLGAGRRCGPGGFDGAIRFAHQAPCFLYLGALALSSAAPSRQIPSFCTRIGGLIVSRRAHRYGPRQLGNKT